MQKINIKAFTLSFGASWGIYMVILGWASYFGWGNQFVDILSSIYVGFSTGFIGGIIGGVWGFIDGAIGGFIFAFIYNLIIDNR